MKALDYYGSLAKEGIDFTRQNGRYSIQADASALIPKDVIAKLDINPADSVLDIGCGLGTNLIPMSFMAAHVTGIDHVDVITRLRTRFDKENVTLHGEDFTDITFDVTFDKIVIYSVLHVLETQEQITAFIDKALSLLKPDGILLLGDIPNIDRKARFFDSARGVAFQKEWDELMKNAQTMPPVPGGAPNAGISIDDEWVMRITQHIRGQGFDTEIRVQSCALPFGNTREDIIVYGPEFSRDL